MATAAIRQRYTPEEYPALERAAPSKSEYIDGNITAMSGVGREHNIRSASRGEWIRGVRSIPACALADHRALDPAPPSSLPRRLRVTSSSASIETCLPGRV
jgi:hypothetical protein